MTTSVWLALALTLLAGMATAIGSVIAFAANRANYRFLSLATGFSAGAMLYVSFVEILLKGSAALVAGYGDVLGHWINTGSFFAGLLLIAIIDRLVPAAENPHETRPDADYRELRAVAGGPQTSKPEAHHQELLHTGLFTALAITIHNFPEGLVTFLAALHDPSLGLAIALAVALHNIPEGISVSVPIFYATGDRRRAFLYSALSGLAEPLGAVIALGLLRFAFGSGPEAIPGPAVGALFAAVAGIMVYISLDELLPTSRAYGRGHESQYGLVAGMAVMALSLLLMK